MDDDVQFSHDIGRHLSYIKIQSIVTGFYETHTINKIVRKQIHSTNFFHKIFMK